MSLIEEIHEASYAGKGESGNYIILVKFPGSPDQFAHQSPDTIHVNITDDQHKASKFDTHLDATWIANFLLEKIGNGYHDEHIEDDGDVHISTTSGGDFKNGPEKVWVTYWSNRPAKTVVEISVERP